MVKLYVTMLNDMIVYAVYNDEIGEVYVTDNLAKVGSYIRKKFVK